MNGLLDDQSMFDRIMTHISNDTTDLGMSMWREPVVNYVSQERFEAELELLRRYPIPFCPSAALPTVGSYVARSAAGTPILAVRDKQGQVRAFRNACRHRGKQVASGSGCKKAFVCGYHGWTYRLDGTLQHIPHSYGFPDVDKQTHGLVSMKAEEKHGLIFVTQQECEDRSANLGELPQLLFPDQAIFNSSEKELDVNWKLFLEANLEGYHIKSTHPKSFYPFGFDNLNVIETFGPNSRITFPFQRIKDLEKLPPQERKLMGSVTYVYQLFPNVILVMLSNHTQILVLEPISPNKTRFINYSLINHYEGQAEKKEVELIEKARHDAKFFADTGSKEDAAVLQSIQDGIASNANEHYTFGYFEKAIVHFHQHLDERLNKISSQLSH